MNLHQDSLPTEQPYADTQDPNTASAPSWFTDAMLNVSKAILGVVHESQHEWLDHRRLPHAIKAHEQLIKPHLLADGNVIILTVFPVATEECYIVHFTPLYNGVNALSPGFVLSQDTNVLPEDYELFLIKEASKFASGWQPVVASSNVHAELKRQVREMKLRACQFLYCTFLKPRVAGTFDDPNGYLAKNTAHSNVVAQPTPTAEPLSNATAPTPL